MTAHNPLRRALLGGSALIGVAALASVLQPRQAHAAMTVFDPSNLAKNAETAAQTMQLVLSNKGILSMAEDTLKKIGINGISADGAAKLFDGGILSAIGHVKDVEGAGRMLMQMLSKDSGGASSIDSVAVGLTTAARYALQNAPAEGGLGPAAQARARSRMETIRTAQVEALGASLFHSQDAAKAATRVQRVADQARTTAGPNGDLRSQIAALTSAVLMSVEEQAKTRQLLASFIGQNALDAQGVGAAIEGSSWGNQDEKSRKILAPSGQVFSK